MAADLDGPAALVEEVRRRGIDVQAHHVDALGCSGGDLRCAGDIMVAAALVALA